MKLWQIPDGGLKSNLTEWIVDLRGHERRVGYIEWHPTASDILLSAGYDYMVCLECQSHKQHCGHCAVKAAYVVGWKLLGYWFRFCPDLNASSSFLSLHYPQR